MAKISSGSLQMRACQARARGERWGRLSDRADHASIGSYRRAVDRGSERTANEGDDIGNLIGLDESLQDRSRPRILEELLLEFFCANFILDCEVGNKLSDSFRRRPDRATPNSRSRLCSGRSPRTFALRDSFLICAMASRTRSSVRPLITTSALSRVNRFAIARPIPAVEPLTNAILPQVADP